MEQRRSGHRFSGWLNKTTSSVLATLERLLNIMGKQAYSHLPCASLPVTRQAAASVIENAPSPLTADYACYVFSSRRQMFATRCPAHTAKGLCSVP